MAVVEGIKTSKFGDDSPKGLYTTGDIKRIAGFHASMAMVDELIGAMTGSFNSWLLYPIWYYTF